MAAILTLWPYAAGGLPEGSLTYLMADLNNTRLTLFFTRDVSLQAWAQVGMFDREVALYQQLQKYDFKVSFVTYGNANDLKFSNQLPGINIRCNHWRLPLPIYEKFLPFLHASCLRQTDIIKTNQTDGAEVALRAARIWGKPLVARCGYMWSEFVARQQGTDSAAALYAQNVEASVFSAAHRVVVTSPEMAARLVKRMSKITSRVAVIPNYVDTDHFRPAANVEREYDIIFVGRLSPQKNVIGLLEAVQVLNLTVMIIGDGELRDQVANHPVNSKGLLVWRSNVPNAKLPQYLNQARLFILPSHYEGHPKALIEAMACGLPVIGANSPGIREIIQHKVNGWLCGTEVDSIRTAIKKLLAQPQLQDQLGSNAREFAVENFALTKVVEMELALLNEIRRPLDSKIKAGDNGQ
jgi:glycosyltransferase involved in cell wall biosynthesis